MRARVSKWGNSLAIRLPKAAIKSLRVHEGEAVDVAIKGEALIIRSVAPYYRLEDLVAEITPDYHPETIDSPPVGKEEF